LNPSKTTNKLVSVTFLIVYITVLLLKFDILGFLNLCIHFPSILLAATSYLGVVLSPIYKDSASL